KSYLSLFPSALENGTLQMNIEVIETGRSIRRVMHYRGDSLDSWYDVSVSRLGRQGVVVTFSDISELKNRQAEVGKQKSLLDNLLAHSPSAISITRVIRNEAGEVVDGIAI